MSSYHPTRTPLSQRSNNITTWPKSLGDPKTERSTKRLKTSIDPQTEQTEVAKDVKNFMDVPEGMPSSPLEGVD